MNKKLEQEVEMLITQYNDKAYIYKNGKVDIIQEGIIRSKQFPSNKEASMYLLKTGWNYV